MGDSNIGTWKLNVAKSIFDPGPPWKSETRVFEAWDTDGVKYTSTGVLADGTRVTGAFSAHYDGKDYTFTATPPPPPFDTIALTRVDANTTAFTVKNSGKVVGTGTVVVSENGTIATRTTTTTNAKGQNEHSVAVFDRQ